MRTRNIAEDEILALSTRDESHFFDRKALGINGKKAQKIAVAFANADGGEFVVGISDDKEEPDPSKRWHGTTKLEDLNGLLQALFTITPTLDLDYEVLASSSKPGQVLSNSEHFFYQPGNSERCSCFREPGAEAGPR